MRDLSILIPARNEEFLLQTIEDILKNKRADTEILVGLDGYWPSPGIPQHPDVKIFQAGKSIGQRAMQNKLARLSNARYVMKVDAHCAFDEGFDVKMLEAFKEAGDNCTLVPVMRNLHIFNWVCKNCGMETYQGPKPEQCRNEMCANEPQNFEKKIVWIPKTNPQSSAYRFNKNLQFKYFPELRNKQEKTGLVETMSLQGSCFMCSRKNYWDLELCDESWGSWGQQGSEVAIKTWLSGGRVLVNMNTWYAHLFRTQHGFSFPYPMDGHSQEKARKISQDIFLNNKWPKQKFPLVWLLEKFWPVLKEVQDPEARWTEDDLKRMKGESTKGIIFYTDNKLKLKIAHAVQKQLKSIGLPIVSASLKPMNFGKNFHVNLERGTRAYFTQILTALENSDSDIVYFCEHDVLYHPSHFDFTPEKDKFYFNINVVKWNLEKGYGVKVDDCKQISGMVCYREHALKFYREKLKQIEENRFDRHFEPQEGRESFTSEYPNIDIRHDQNFTPSRWSSNEFRNKKFTEGWTELSEIGGWNMEWLRKM